MTVAHRPVVVPLAVRQRASARPGCRGMPAATSHARALLFLAALLCYATKGMRWLAYNKRTACGGCCAVLRCAALCCAVPVSCVCLSCVLLPQPRPVRESASLTACSPFRSLTSPQRVPAADVYQQHNCCSPSGRIWPMLLRQAPRTKQTTHNGHSVSCRHLRAATSNAVDANEKAKKHAHQTSTPLFHHGRHYS